MIVETAYGKVEGAGGAGGVAAFKGVPFARPPVGPLRFRPPMPPEPWAGIRPAVEYGPAAPQPLDEILEGMFGHPPFVTDEGSCLTLNVWTPATGAGSRPVLVWLHGGAFLTGSGSDLVFDGTRLAALQDVVVVTVNYRLGALGFLYLGEVGYEDSANLGLLDQVAALGWVRDNIAAFGGDSGNVTVFGQSAGAMSTACLMTMPAAQGLFGKAIMQSGSGEETIEPSRAAAVTRELLGVLGIDPGAPHSLHDIPAAGLIRAQQTVGEAMRARGEGTGLPFAPVVDGVVLSRRPIDAVRAGEAADIPLLLGTNREEGRMFTVLDPGPPAIDESALPFMFGAAYTDGDRALEVFRAAEHDPSPLGLFAALIGERMFRAPTERLAEAAAAMADVWLYSFNWRSTARSGDLGACHSLELAFVFDNLDVPGVAKFTGDTAPQSLATQMSTAWCTFARHGTPSPTWPSYNPSHRPTMVFGERSEIVNDPYAALRLA